MSKYQTDSLFMDSRLRGNDIKSGNDIKEGDDKEQLCGNIIRVAFELAADTEFDYLVPDGIGSVEVGQRVEVPFGRKNKLQTGFCVETDIDRGQEQRKKKKFRLKKVVQVLDKGPLVDAGLMELARWIGSYYICPLGQVLAAMVPAAVKKGVGVKKQKYIYLSGSDQSIEKLSGRKQRQIVKYLQAKRAFNSKEAVELQRLLTEVGCTKGPVKSLAQKLILKTAEKVFFKSLPAVPDALSLKADTVTPNQAQQKALAYIYSQIDSGAFGVTVLHGVTDSGKTEVYIRAIEMVLQKCKGAIVLLPEIALTAQTVQRFSSRFEKIAVMHSGLTASQRNSQWQKIKAGQADVVIGARSAIFAPMPKLGLVVVDEEHEPSYKQDAQPRYNGRDVAIKRAQLANAHCILGSATPSLETLLNCRSRKHFSLVSLPRRVMNLPTPEMKLVDLRQEYSTHKGITLISEPLAKHLKEALARKEQAILLLNRRGYSNFVFCPSCRHTLHCRNCDVTLTFHKSRLGGTGSMQTVTGKHIGYGYAVCHYCLAQTLVPEKCPLCGKGMAMIGVGSQRLEEELVQRFPQARVARIDSDSMAGADYYKLLKDFSEGRIDILAGTQMLAKGLHFPNVTVVGIIRADTCLYLPDFRANERTFQLISQVAGRTGRSRKKGIVFVQTFLAEQPAIQFALKNDFDGFVKEELKHRQACKLPPFSRLAVILMRDTNFDKLEAAGKQMRERIDSIVQREAVEVNITGPIPAGISRIQRFHRMQIIIRGPKAADILRLLDRLKASGTFRDQVRVAIDIDPINLL